MWNISKQFETSCYFGNLNFKVYRYDILWTTMHKEQRILPDIIYTQKIGKVSTNLYTPLTKVYLWEYQLITQKQFNGNEIVKGK